MRRLLRILLNAATVLSLVLCVVTMAAWARSYQASDEISWWGENPLQRVEIVTYRGGYTAAVVTPTKTPWLVRYRLGVQWRELDPARYGDELRSRGTYFNLFGFAFESRDDWAYWTQIFACPYWFILLLTAIMPAARLIGWRRRRARRLRMAFGLCQRCGYDCRATPERCPECGTTLVMAATPAREGKGETEGV